MITVTKGQWFPITISNIQYWGVDFDLQGAKDVKAALVSTTGVRAELEFTISAFNELSAVSDGNIAPGKYSVEVAAVGSDGKNYSMRSPFAVIEITNSTTPSGSSKARIAGDNWELTADVEMHEGQARTYMSLLEEARKKALQAATDAEAVIDNVQSSVTQAQEAVKTAQEASTNASNAVTNANKAISDANNTLQSITTMEGTVSTAEQGRKDAESERVTAEQGREKEMKEYMLVIKKPIISTSEETVIMDANKFYNITIGTILTLDINPPQDTVITNDWEGCFDTNTVAPTVTWPANVNWGTSCMTLAINTHYEFSIRQSGGKLYGILYGWSLS